MLELDFVNMHKRNGEPLSLGYVHGDLFGVGGVRDHARQSARPAQLVARESRQRTRRVEHLRRGRRRRRDQTLCQRQIRQRHPRSTQKKGYLCLESEGAEIHFRNIQIMELPPGVTTPEQTAPEI